MSERIGSLVVNVEGDTSKFVSDIQGAVVPAINSIGKAADAGSETYGRATRRMQAHLEQQIRSANELATSIENGGRNTIASINAVIRQRGLEVQALAPLVTQLEAARKRADDLSAAQRNAATSAQFLADLTQRANSIGKTAADLAEMKAQALGVSTAAAPLIARLREQEAVTAKLGATSANTTQQMRMVAPQITDIVTQLAGGQSPMQIFIQQGGQLKDVFGGAGPALRAVGGYIFGLINPVTVAAALLGGLGFAAFKGAGQVGEFNRQIILSGNDTGKTTDQLRGMAVQLAGLDGVMQGTALDSIGAMASMGRVAGDELLRYTRIATQLDKLVGKPVADTVKEFAQLGTSPVEASLRLNEQYRYLTASVYSQIRALQEQGRTTDAVTLAQNTFAGAIESRMPAMVANVGYLERAWNGVASAIKGVADAAMDLGRPQSVQQQADTLRDLIRQRQERNASLGIRDGKATQEMQQQLNYLTETMRMQSRGADAAQRTAEATKARAAFEKLVDDSMTKQERMARDIAQAEKLSAESGATREETEKVIANIRKKGFEADPYNAQIEALKQQLALREQATRYSVDVTNALYQRGALSQIQTIEMVGQAEVNALQGNTDLIRQQIAQAQTKKDSMKEVAELRGKLAQTELAIVLRTAKTEQDVKDALYKQGLAAYMRYHEERMQAEQDWAREMDAAARRSAAAGEEVNNYSRAIDLQNDQLAFDIELLGKSVRMQDEANARRRIELDLRERLRAIAGSDITADEAAALRARAEEAAARAQASVSATVFVAEFNRVNPVIGQNLYDVLTGKARSAARTMQSIFGQLVMKPVVMAASAPVSAFVTGALASSGLGSLGKGSGVLGLAAAGSAFGSGLGAGFSALTGESGLAGALSAGQVAIGAGNVAAGLGTIAGAMGPIMLGIAAVIAIASKYSGETRSGAQYGYNFGTGLVNPRRDELMANAALGVNFLEGPSGGELAAEQVRASITSTVNGINAVLKGVGSTATLAAFQAGLESSDRGRGGVFSGGALSTGAMFGESGRGSNYDGTLFERTSPQTLTGEQALTAFATDLKQVTLQALQAAADIPASISTKLAGIDIEALTDQAATDLLATITSQVDAVNALRQAVTTLPFAQLQTLSFDAASGLLALVGGVEQLGNQLKTYYDNFYSEQERTANTLASITSTLTSLGLSVPSTREAFRQLVEAQDLATDAGRRNYAALLGVADAFAQITPVATAAAAVVTAVVTDTAQALRSQTDAALRAVEQAVAAQRKTAQAALQVAQEQKSALSGLFDLLGGQVRELYGEVASARSTSAAGAQAYIAQALATAKASGYLPDSTSLQAAISAARAGLNATDYRSTVAFDRARLTLAQQLKDLQDIAGPQLSTADQTLAAVQSQVDQLDQQLAYWQQQIELARGQVSATLSVAAAVNALATALGQETGLGTNAGTATRSGTSMPFVTGPGMAGAALNPGFVIGPNLPSFDVGTPYVPQDMIAKIHKGEAIMPAQTAAAWRDGAGGPGSDLLAALLAELQALRADARTGRADEREVQTLLDLIEKVISNWERNGVPVINQPGTELETA